MPFQDGNTNECAAGSSDVIMPRVGVEASHGGGLRVGNWGHEEKLFAELAHAVDVGRLCRGPVAVIPLQLGPHTEHHLRYEGQEHGPSANEFFLFESWNR